jgi:hypothetical protein
VRGRMRCKAFRSISVPFILLGALALLGCKEEKPVVYSERVAILPDKSGLLVKEVRSLGKSQNEMVIKEVVGGSVKEIILIPLIDFPDVKFRFKALHDTILLLHTQSDFEKVLQVLNRSAFPIRTEQVSPAEWLSTGTIEGDPIFYAEDKWGAYFDLVRKP